MLARLLFVLTLAPFVINAAEVPKRITLQDAFLAATEKTEHVKIAESQSAESSAVVSEVRGRLLPNLTLNGQYTKSDPADASFARDSSRTEQRTVRFSLLQSLFNKQNYENLSAAKSLNAADQQRVEQQRLALYAQVAQAYFSVKAYESDVRNLTTTIELGNSRIKELSSRIKIGRSRSGDFFAAQSQLALLQQQLELARGGLQNARENFTNVTGLPSNSDLQEQAPPKTIQPLTQYLANLDSRPDLKAQQHEVQATEARVSSAKAGHWPTLNLTGNYYLLRRGSSEGVDWDFGVGLVIPIYSGGEVQAQVRQATEQEVQARLNENAQRRNAENEVRSAYANFISSIAQANALESASQASERNYREQVRDYRLSLITNLDVVQALNTLQDVKRSHDRAVIQAAAAYATLQAASAQLNFPGSVQ